jgi:hypothetical protein
MPAILERLRCLLPGLWLGWLLCVALLATPAVFATLPAVDAGRVAARMLAQEAYTSLALGAMLLVLERWRVLATVVPGGFVSPFDAGMVLALASLFCTLAGYFAVQPMMASARAGQGPVGFVTLHAASAIFFALKCAVLLALAWRAAGAVRLAGPSS